LSAQTWINVTGTQDERERTTLPDINVTGTHAHDCCYFLATLPPYVPVTRDRLALRDRHVVYLRAHNISSPDN